MPTLHKSIHLMQIDSEALVHAAIERAEAPIFSPAHTSDPVAVLIGPEGGWSNGEIEWLNAQSFIHPVSLGPRILRAETAAIFMLSRI